MCVLDTLNQALVVSCQPLEHSPMNTADIIVAMAKTAENSGAGAVRIEGVENVAAVRHALKIPIIGIVKRITPDTPVVITPQLSDISELVAAGADIIAVDATARSRPVAVETLITSIHAANRLAMADCATLDDGKGALEMECDIIGTTLSGYTTDTQPCSVEPDFSLLQQFAELTHNSKTLTMAEGRFNTPELAANALRHGADCVTVGSAITRMENIVGWFTDAMQKPPP